MNRCDMLEQIILPIESIFQSLAQTMSMHNKQIVWTVEHYSTEYFPLTIYLSMNTYEKADDETTIMLRIQQIADGMLRAAIDLSRQTGEILVDGPEVALEEPIDSETIMHLKATVECFVEHIYDKIARELRSRKVG